MNVIFGALRQIVVNNMLNKKGERMKTAVKIAGSIFLMVLVFSTNAWASIIVPEVPPNFAPFFIASLFGAVMEVRHFLKK